MYQIINFLLHKKQQQKEAQELSAQAFLGIKKFDNGLVYLDDGGCSALLECGNIVYPLLTDDEKTSVEIAFGQYLSSLDFPVQLYTQTRLLDITDTIERLEKVVAERQGLRREYLIKTIDTLREWMSYRSVLLRRNLVVLNYKGETEAETLEELNQRIALVRDGLDRVEELSPVLLGTNEVVEVLYVALNKERALSARLKDLLNSGVFNLYVTSPKEYSCDKQTNHFRRNIENGGKKIRGGTNNIIDLISPDGIKIYDEHVKCGGNRWLRTYVVTMEPGELYVGWLDSIYQFGDVDVSIHIDPVDPFNGINELSDYIYDLETQQKLARKRHDHHKESKFTSAIQSAWELRANMQQGNNKLFYTTIVINVAAETLEELNKKSRLIERSMGGRGIHVRQAFLKQKQAFKTALPLGQNLLSNQYRNYDLGATVSLFPFSSAELSHQNGVVLGENLLTGGPALFNNFLPSESFNFNVNVFAKSGAGKSTLIKLLTARGDANDEITYFIDWEGEYGPIVEALGGINYVISPNSNHTINPFDIEVDEKTGKLNLLEKVLKLKDLFGFMAESLLGEKLSAYDLALIEEIIKALYEKKEIKDQQPESLYEHGQFKEGDNYVFGRRKKALPTITDFCQYAEKLGASESIRLAKIYSQFMRGRTMGLFDGQTTADFKNAHMISFDISGLDKKYLKPFSMYVILGWMIEVVKTRPHIKKRVVADEAQNMLLEEYTADFLEYAGAQIRKRSGSLLVSAQNFKKFARHPKGETILTNAGTTILMKQDAADIQAAADIFHLSQGEINFLRGCRKGDALVRLDKISIPIHVTYNGFEKPLVETTYVRG